MVLARGPYTARRQTILLITKLGPYVVVLSQPSSVRQARYLTVLVVGECYGIIDTGATSFFGGSSREEGRGWRCLLYHSEWKFIQTASSPYEFPHDRYFSAHRVSFFVYLTRTPQDIRQRYTCNPMGNPMV